MIPRDELERLANRCLVGDDSLASVLDQAYAMGVEAAWRMDQEAGRVFRVLGPRGLPRDRRCWSQRGPAILALNHRPRGGRVQEGKVIWINEGGANDSIHPASPEV